MVSSKKDGVAWRVLIKSPMEAEDMDAALMPTIFQAPLSGGLATLVLGRIPKKWIELRLKPSIEHEYNRRLSDYQAETRDKQDAFLERLKAQNAERLVLHFFQYSQVST